MKTLKVTWKGVTPLIMHSCQCVNPLHPIAKELKKYTSKRTKTDEDYEIISNLEWEGGLYWKDGIGLYIPPENIEATMINGGKSNKKGTDIKKYVSVEESYIPLVLRENLTKDQMKADFKYRDVRQMCVQRARITRTRPRFDTWEIVFTLRYEEEKIDIETIVNALEYAGKYVGLCDSRPKYGQFQTIVEELS